VGSFFLKKKQKKKKQAIDQRCVLISMNKYLVAFAENTNIIIRN
jgi:hypothetical protein